MRSAEFYISPEGWLQPEHFPSLDSLPGAIQTWAQEADSRYEDQTAQDHWVYHRGFGHIAQRLYYDFSTADVEQKGNFRRTEAQMKHFATLSERHKQKAEEIASEESATREGSKTVRMNVRW